MVKRKCQHSIHGYHGYGKLIKITTTTPTTPHFDYNSKITTSQSTCLVPFAEGLPAHLRLHLPPLCRHEIAQVAYRLP